MEHLKHFRLSCNHIPSGSQDIEDENLKTKPNSIYWWLPAIACLVIPHSLFTQNPDTVLWIDEIAIADHSLIGAESDTIPIDELTATTYSASELLRSRHNIYFRNFGPGSSSTVSMFGSRSNEVALVWNGIKIANPMLGVNDFSMIPLAGLSSLRIARTGTSTIFGAGSGAGAIILGQEIPTQDSSFSLTAGWSTLHEIKLSGGMTHIGKGWKSRTTIGGMTARNDYRYTTLDGDHESLPHARNQYLNGTHHSEFELRPHQKLSLSLWAHHQFREIPPTLTEVRSEADQSDQFLRTVLQYKHLGNRHNWHIKAYYGHQQQTYRNPRINLHASHIFDNIQLRMDNQWQPLHQVDIKYGLQNNYSISRSDNYQDNKSQNRIAAYTQLRYAFPSFPAEFIVLLQPEWVSEPLPGWTTEVKFRYRHPKTGWWTLFANKNIVWPTLNDLYWVPGGNPELQPEQNKVAGIIWKNDWPSNLHHTLSFYYKDSDAWIQWIPGDLGFWSPVNVSAGRSYGVNLEIKKSWAQLEVNSGYQYVRTLIRDHGNRQAIYSPEHMWTFGGNLRINDHWSLRMDGEYTSTRYVTRDHSQSLDPYFLCHSTIHYSPGQQVWSIGFRVYNMLNTSFQGIINRPMPGRQFQIITKINF